MRNIKTQKGVTEILNFFQSFLLHMLRELEGLSTSSPPLASSRRSLMWGQQWQTNIKARYFHIQPPQTRHVMDLLSHRVGLEDRHFLMCPTTHSKSPVNVFWVDKATHLHPEWHLCFPVFVPWDLVFQSVLWLLEHREDPGEVRKHLSQTQTLQLFTVSVRMYIVILSWINDTVPQSTYRWASLASWTRFACNTLLNKKITVNALTHGLNWKRHF